MVCSTRSGARSAIRRNVAQSLRWIDMPLPRVTKPLIGSGGAGRQQRASCVRSASTPTTSTPVDAPCATFAPLARFSKCAGASGSRTGRRRVGQRLLDVAQAELFLADDRKQLVRRLEAELRREVLEIHRRLALALQRLFDERATVRDVLLLIDRVEPRAHLLARARAAQIAELRIEPVARRAALLHRDDLDRLAVRERRVERHHRAVDARPRHR
ncbi:hypothetical protein [Burkholderia thailandensis]|uniref:hypothetical protein n=1 Tax=Burkholderia thailandensis TaxID=57975 RepID=UPI001EE1E348|nr:hypothetical protein [Burkholderia thailandensis]